MKALESQIAPEVVPPCWMKHHLLFFANRSNHRGENKSGVVDPRIV